MKIKYIYIVIIFIIILLCKCEEEYYDYEEEGIFDDYDPSKDIEIFQESLKKYLTANDLINSDRLIEREEMKKIFLEIILEQDVESLPDYLRGIIDFLTKHFLDKYYKKKKNKIRGKDIYDLIDITAISRKFQQLTGNPDYDDIYYDEEEDEYTDDVPDKPGSEL